MNPLGVNIVSQMPKCLLDNLLKDSELGPMFEKIDRERFVHMMASIFTIINAENVTHDPEKLQIVTSNMRKWHSRMAISREQLDRWLSVAEVTLLQLGAEAPLVAEVVHHLAAIFGHFSHSLEAGDAVERSPPPLAKIFCQEDTETRRSKDFRESYPM